MFKGMRSDDWKYVCVPRLDLKSPFNNENKLLVFQVVVYNRFDSIQRFIPVNLLNILKLVRKQRPFTVQAVSVSHAPGNNKY